jgi:chemotaxis protein methyltransferase CheR
MSLKLERADVHRFRALVGRRLGLEFDDSKLEYLADVLEQRLKTSDCSGLEAYAHCIGDNGREEWRALAEQLTINETYFFRYWDHFRAFFERVLEERVRVRRPAQKLRILSAGCASGEEAYSLAILIREHLPDYAAFDIKILGVDVNLSMLEKAGRALYSPWSLRTTPEHLRQRYFHATGRDFQLDAAVAESVDFEEANLVEDDAKLWRPETYDLVFCRNVTMYFAPEVTRAVVDRIARALVPGGFLFLGHAETLRGVSQDFHLCHTHDTFYYQRRSGAEIVANGDGGAGAWAPSRAAPAAELDANDSTWVDVIHRASERIALLAQHSPHLHASSKERPGAQHDSLRQAWDLRAAIGMLEKERFGEALDLLKALPVDARLDPDTLLLRAVVLTNSGQLAEAEQVCKELLLLDELNAGAHYLMALCMEHAGDLGAALEHDRTAAYLEDGFAMPHLHMGMIAGRTGESSQARAELGKALRLLPREDASRILLFGGGFGREALTELCRSLVKKCKGAP